MYTPQASKTTIKRFEFKVESPYGAQYHATVRDITDTIHVALAKLREVKGEKAADYDDALRVYADDDGIVFYFEKEA
jgi:hypothetical protein